MSYMFGICKKMTGFRGRFNTSQVTDMSYMFIGCNNLKTLDLSGFDTQRVTDMKNMFNASVALTSLDLSSFNSHGPGECHQSTINNNH